MSTPRLITAPSDPVVGLSALKDHCRVNHGEDDALIVSLEAAAVAYLDGWKGVLGRCVMPQTWAQDYTGAGPYLLAMPDVVSVTVTQDGEPLSGAVLTNSACGPVVTIADNTDDVTIEYECAMPAQQVAAAQMLVKLMVANWYENREATTAGAMVNLPYAVDALISAMRWRSA